MSKMNKTLPLVSYKPVRESEHALCIYSDYDCLLGCLDDYFGSVETMVVIARRGLGRRMTTNLGTKGMDVEKARREGRLVLLETGRVLCRFLVRKKLDKSRFLESVGEVIWQAVRTGRRVRVYDETVATLAGRGNWEGAMRLEKLWDEMLAIYPFTLLCGYPSDLFLDHRKNRVTKIYHCHANGQLH